MNYPSIAHEKLSLRTNFFTFSASFDIDAALYGEKYRIGAVITGIFTVWGRCVAAMQIVVFALAGLFTFTNGRR